MTDSAKCRQLFPRTQALISGEEKSGNDFAQQGKRNIFTFTNLAKIIMNVLSKCGV
jgi:hypothetical protein